MRPIHTLSRAISRRSNAAHLPRSIIRSRLDAVTLMLELQRESIPIDGLGKVMNTFGVFESERPNPNTVSRFQIGRVDYLFRGQAISAWRFCRCIPAAPFNHIFKAIILISSPCFLRWRFTPGNMCNQFQPALVLHIRRTLPVFYQFSTLM